MKINKVSAILLIIFLASVYAILLAQKINLTTADLGRHLKNGELFLQNFSVPQGNLYSYTYPDYPFVNHHWGTGVIFYLIYSFVGFKGLSIFFILVSLATFFIFFDIASKYSNLFIASIVSIFIIPILGSRVEIRPEAFSYLFCGAFFWILLNYRKEKISWRWLLILPIIEVLWINLHIYFFLGLALIGVFIVAGTIKQIKSLGIILFSSCLAVLINPAGINGAIYPLKIFGNYGYRLLENQSVWFVEKLMSYPPTLYFEIVFGILMISWAIAVYMAIKKRAASPVIVVNFIITIAFSAAAWLMIRNFPLFGYFALPIAAINFKNLTKKLPVENEKSEYFTTVILGAIILIVLIMINQNYWRSRSDIGFGLEPEVEKAAEFFQKENLTGPIFNNYDLGGYLIYYLYPQEHVFVDNRPEAYPKSFFEEIYMPMQENNEKWQEELEKYNFNAIFFYRNDLTPWGQSFLIKRVSDPDWAPVYVDDYSIIFLKRNRTNESIIQKYELPKNMFIFTQNS